MKRRMRLFLSVGVLVAVLLALLLLRPLLTQQPQPKSSVSSNSVVRAATSFVARCGIHFCLDGHPYYFGGANSYDLFTFGDGTSKGSKDAIENLYMDKAKIDATMQNMENDKVMVVRTWMFDHEQWHGFETAKGVYNDAQFDEFDYIIQSAKAHNIKLLPSFENYDETYGGIDTRLQWEGLPTGEANRWRFFNQQKCPGCFTQYQNYVNHALNHVNHYSGVAYKDDPTIFAWELMNEPSYEGATPNEDTTEKTLRTWVDTMGAYVKSIDANHLLSVGLEGQQTTDGDGDNAENPTIYVEQSPYIDFTSAHLYPAASWEKLTQAQTKTLIERLINDSHNVMGKPFVMGEYNVEASSNRTSWWKAILGDMESAGGDGDAFWLYVARNSGGTLDITPGDPALTVFHQHVQNLQAKNKGAITTLSPTQTSVSAATPVFGLACQVHYSVQSQWSGGFSSNITIMNSGTVAINHWTLQFAFTDGQLIQQGWSGTYAQQGSVVTVTAPSYSTSIGVKQSTVSGFNATWTGSNPIPILFKLNGTTCNNI